MKTKFLFIAFAACLFGSCKKDYSCECTINSAVYSTKTLHETKSDADKDCKSYCCPYGCPGALNQGYSIK